MADSLDDIFSPERLRHHWQQPDETAADSDEEKTAVAVPQGVMEVFHRLYGLIKQRFPGEKAEPLNVMLEELQELLLKRFPQTGDVEVSEEEKADLNSAIQQLLNDVEDLVEALEL
jgi:hypothetical protein